MKVRDFVERWRRREISNEELSRLIVEYVDSPEGKAELEMGERAIKQEQTKGRERLYELIATYRSTGWSIEYSEPPAGHAKTVIVTMAAPGAKNSSQRGYPDFLSTEMVESAWKLHASSLRPGGLP